MPNHQPQPQDDRIGPQNGPGSTQTPPPSHGYPDRHTDAHRGAQRPPHPGSDTTWHTRGACTHLGPGLWDNLGFNDDPNPRTRAKAHNAARSICQHCPVQPQCLAWALLQPDRLAGIWGGTGREQRRRIQAAMAKSDTPPGPGRPPPLATWHGTTSGYYRHRCRCPACHLAMTHYRRQPHRAEAQRRNDRTYRNRKHRRNCD